MQLVDRRFPLPLGSVINRRSLIFLGNLVEAIEACLTHPAAAGKTYLVSDESAVSTPELIEKIGRALGCSPRLLPFPPALLQRMARLIGKSREVDRLLGTLEIDSSRIRKDLDWRPSKSMEEGLQMTADWYQAS
jgi:nucleoside-diphosphate-sugar epimerase